MGVLNVNGVKVMVSMVVSTCLDIHHLCRCLGGTRCVSDVWLVLSYTTSRCFVVVEYSRLKVYLK